MFRFIKKTLSKIYSAVTSKLTNLFSSKKIDTNTLHELEVILLAADTGVPTTKKIMTQLNEHYTQGKIQEGADLKKALGYQLKAILEKPSTPKSDARVFILVGINGSGKTTFAAKLANRYSAQGKKVLFVAADTFRAAAQEQLDIWAQKTGCNIIKGKDGQDPASVVFAGCQEFIDGNYDILIIDTAGRLQTKVNLMNELAKLQRVIAKKLPDQSIHVLLAIDSMLGQNSLEQARLFQDCTPLHGIVLTKMDGTGKGGIVFAIADELNLPVAYITYGEQLDQIKEFNTNEYVDNLLNS